MLASPSVRRGPPAYIRSDNGPEFMAQAGYGGGWDAIGVQTLFIEPGVLGERYIESFNGRLCD